MQKYISTVFCCVSMAACVESRPAFNQMECCAEAEFDSYRYLMIPVDESNEDSDVEVFTGTIEQHLKIRLAEADVVDYYVPLKCEGRTRIRIMGRHSDFLFDNMRFSKEHHYEYASEYRPYMHFTSHQGWINDPNGLIYLDGKYHLYYQHNPYGAKWGNMTWGHAVTSDFIHWEHCGDALFPDKNGNAFSGCCVVDYDDAAGFGKNALLAFYTSDAPSGQTQSLAYSLDGGMTFDKYEGNPILASDTHRDFRDPKVFRHESSSRWIMALAVAKSIHFYSSDDLKRWRFESEFTYPDTANDAIVWECPDIFQMKGADGTQKWVLVNSNLCRSGSMSKVRYFIGQFDGQSFVAETSSDDEVRLVDNGPDFYASATYAQAPDGRTVMASWMNGVAYAGETPYTGGFRGVHSLPRDLFLYAEDGRWHVGNIVSPEVRDAASSVVHVDDFSVVSNERVDVRVTDTPYCIKMKIADVLSPFTISLSAEDMVTLAFVPDENIVTIDRSKSGDCSFSDRFVSSWDVKIPSGDVLEMELWVDRTSVECFFNGGRASSTFQVFPSRIYDTVSIEASDSSVDVSEIEIMYFR